MEKMSRGFIIALLLTGCNEYQSASQPINQPPQQQEEQQEQEQQQRHDFTSIAPLYMSPYIVTATEYKATLSVELIRGNMSCQGECDLPLTGYDSTMFNIATGELLTDAVINSRSKSFVCYAMSSGWYVVNYQYQGRSWWVESQESCYHGTYQIDPSQWEWDTVESAFADVRGFGSWSFSM